MTAVATLAKIIAQRGKSSQAYFQHQIGYDQLVETGFVRVHGIAQSVFCVSCDDPHDAEVVYQSRTYGYYCPEAGFASLDDHNIRAVEPNIAKLVTDLAIVFDCKRRKSTPVNGNTWRIGAIDTPAGDLTLYFHPSLQRESDVGEVRAAFANEINSAFRLIITAIGALPVSGAKTARLTDIVELVDSAGSLAAISAPHTIAGAPLAAKNGRPSTYAGKLSSLISQRSETGEALNGRNEEAKAVAQRYRARHPKETTPSLPTIKRHITLFRAGS